MDKVANIKHYKNGKVTAYVQGEVAVNIARRYGVCENEFRINREYHLKPVYQKPLRFRFQSEENFNTFAERLSTAIFLSKLSCNFRVEILTPCKDKKHDPFSI